MRVITIIFLFFLTTTLTIGQTAGDALRYSYWQNSGSARSMGVGGSMGALGGDYSSIISNPASIATYRRSELTFTPSVLISGTNSTFAGNENKKSKTNVTINQAGLVFAKPKADKWKTVNFGIGYNKLAEFNQEFNYRGDTPGSIADHFVELASGLTPDQLSDYDSGIAYDAGVIYQPDPTNLPTYYENDLFSTDETSKFQTVRASGSIGELNLAIGGNMNHKLYLGGSIGIPFLEYRLSKSLEEEDHLNTIDYFDKLTFTEGLTTSGVGVNVNLGAIYRVNQAIRIGAAFHSPTWFSLTDNYSSTIDFDYTNQGVSSTASEQSPDGFFEYKMKTPMRFIGNAGFLIKKKGFVTAEAEWVDYGKSAYNYSSDFATASILDIEEQTNQEIQSFYQGALNLKVGGEYVIQDVYRVRAGYALFGNPYVNNSGMFDSSRLSAGLGYRKDNFFLDLAYTRALTEQTYAPYVLTSGLTENSTIENKISKDNIILTLGFKFGGRRAK